MRPREIQRRTRCPELPEDRKNNAAEAWRCRFQGLCRSSIARARRKWDATEKEIAVLAGVARSTYYNVRDRDEAVKHAMENFHRR